MFSSLTATSCILDSSIEERKYARRRNLFAKGFKLLIKKKHYQATDTKIKISNQKIKL